jgi:hypothetical protein
MTPEARAEMREKVREIIADGCSCDRFCRNENPIMHCGCLNDADAAIAAALEQAAQHFEAFADDLFTGKRVVYEIRALITPGKEEREG